MQFPTYRLDTAKEVPKVLSLLADLPNLMVNETLRIKIKKDNSNLTSLCICLCQLIENPANNSMLDFMCFPLQKIYSNSFDCFTLVQLEKIKTLFFNFLLNKPRCKGSLYLLSNKLSRKSPVCDNLPTASSNDKKWQSKKLIGERYNFSDDFVEFF